MKVDKVIRMILLMFVIALTPLVLVACGKGDSSDKIEININNAISVIVNNDSLKGKYNQTSMSYEFIYGEEISLNYAEDFTVKLNYEDGTSKVLVYKTDYNVVFDMPANADVGTYSANFESNGYSANISITIKPRPIACPTLSATNFIYTGDEQGPTIDYHGFENFISVTGSVTAIEKGSYDLSFSLNSQNYEWNTPNGSSTLPQICMYYITEQVVDKPTVAATNSSDPVDGVYLFTWAYDADGDSVVARAQGVTIDIPEEYASVIDVNGDYLTSTDIGTYYVYVFLNDLNYEFSDGSTSFTVEYKIDKLVLTKPLLTQTEYTYTGENVELSFDDNFDANLMNYDLQSDPRITYDDYGAETQNAAISTYVSISYQYANNICWAEEDNCNEYTVEYHILRKDGWLPSSFDQTNVEFVVKYNKANENLNSYIPNFNDMLYLTDTSKQYLSELDLFNDNEFFSWSETSKSSTLAMGDNEVELIYSRNINYYSPQNLTVNVKLEKAEVNMTNFAWNEITGPYAVHNEGGVEFPYKFMIQDDVNNVYCINLDTDNIAIDNPLEVVYYYSLEPFKTDDQFEDESAKSAYWTSCIISGASDDNFTHAGYYKVVYGNIDREHYTYVQFDAYNNKTEWNVLAVKEYSVAQSDFDLSSMNGTALDVESGDWSKFYFNSGSPMIDCVGSLFNDDYVTYSYYYSAISTSDLDAKFANSETISTADMKERGSVGMEDSGYLKIGYYRRIVTISYNKNDYNMIGLANAAAVIDATEGKIVIATDFEVTKVRLVSEAKPMKKLFCYDNGYPLSAYETPQILLNDNYYESDRPYTNNKDADVYEVYNSETDTWQVQDKTAMSAVGKYRTSSVFTVNENDYYAFYEEGVEKGEITLVHEFEILETPFASLTIADSTLANLHKDLEKFKYSTLLPIDKELSITVNEGYTIDMSIGAEVLFEGQNSATFTFDNENKDSTLYITIKDTDGNVVLEAEKTCMQISSNTPFDGITLNGTAITLENEGTTMLHWLDVLDYGEHEQFVYRMNSSSNQLGWYTNAWEVPYTFTNTSSSTKYQELVVYYNSITYGFESTALFVHLFKLEVFEDLRINDVKQEVVGSNVGSYEYWYDKDATTQIKINISAADIAKMGTIYYSLVEDDAKQEIVGGEVVLLVSVDNTLYRLCLYRLDATTNNYESVGEIYFYPYELALESFDELKINDVALIPTATGTYEFQYSPETTNFNIAVSTEDVERYNGYTLWYSVGLAEEMITSYEMTGGSRGLFITEATHETTNEGYIYYKNDETKTTVFVAKILLTEI